MTQQEQDVIMSFDEQIVHTTPITQSQIDAKPPKRQFEFKIKGVVAGQSKMLFYVYYPLTPNQMVEQAKQQNNILPIMNFSIEMCWDFEVPELAKKLHWMGNNSSGKGPSLPRLQPKD